MIRLISETRFLNTVKKKYNKYHSIKLMCDFKLSPYSGYSYFDKDDEVYFHYFEDINLLMIDENYDYPGLIDKIKSDRVSLIDWEMIKLDEVVEYYPLHINSRYEEVSIIEDVLIDEGNYKLFNLIDRSYYDISLIKRDNGFSKQMIINTSDKKLELNKRTERELGFIKKIIEDYGKNNNRDNI